MRQLIVNADDFGLTRGVNSAIEKGFREGIITSATLMATGDAFADAVEVAKRNPKLGVGCHLVLVGGRSVAPTEQVPSLANESGELPNSLLSFFAGVSTGRIRVEEIEREMRAQVQKIQRAGFALTHFDTHKHTHCHPRVMSVLARVAQDLGVPRVRKPFEDRRFARVSSNGAGRFSLQGAAALISLVVASSFSNLIRRTGLATPDYFCGISATGRIGPQALLQIISCLPEGTTELMCHPGYADAELESLQTRLKSEREQELASLLDPALRSALSARGVRLISYRELS